MVGEGARRKSCNRTGGLHRDLCGRQVQHRSCGKLRTAGRGGAGLLNISQIFVSLVSTLDLFTCQDTTAVGGPHPVLAQSDSADSSGSQEDCKLVKLP